MSNLFSSNVWSNNMVKCLESSSHDNVTLLTLDFQLKVDQAFVHYGQCRSIVFKRTNLIFCRLFL